MLDENTRKRLATINLIQPLAEPWTSDEINQRFPIDNFHIARPINDRWEEYYYQREFDTEMTNHWDPENEEHIVLWRESVQARWRETQSIFPYLFLPKPQENDDANSMSTEDIFVDMITGGKRKHGDTLSDTDDGSERPHHHPVRMT